ncbi:MAG TPA: hypothetical protein VK723_04160 [Thermoplasmata archaeon]|nr:hypothetical protein [Thermoplasmata archaeon]
MTRRATRRGGALKGLAAVLAFLVVLFLYLSLQSGMSPDGFLALLLSVPLWFYIAVLSVGVVFVATLARENVIASRAAKDAAAKAERKIPSRPLNFPVNPETLPPARERPHRMVIDFVPIKPGSSAISASIAGSSEDEPATAESPGEAPAVNVWPTESISLGKRPQDRAPRHSPPPSPVPIALSPAIPEPYLGPELESGSEPATTAPMEAAAANGPPDSLLGRLMNWLDETSPEAVAPPEPANRKKTRRGAKKKSS